ncbi:MAG: LysR substrate-binding domain-containing protein [Pseudomonadota bacterium]
MPPLNALKAFEALGRRGRMTLAAEELSITHGAVSRQVRHLEAVLGVSLFEGPKTRQRLTAAGRQLLAALSDGLDTIESGVARVTAKPRGQLAVSCVSTFTMRWLIPRLFRFKRIAPELEVRLSAADGPPRLAAGGLDLAIRVGRPPWPEGLAATPFLAEAAGPVLSPKLLDGRQLADSGDLAAWPRLHTATRRTAWHDWLADVGAAPFEPPASQTFEHFYFLLEAATAGLGVAIGPWPLVADDIKAGRLVAPFGFRPNGLSYVAFTPKRPDPACKAFVAWLAGEGAAYSAAPEEALDVGQL